MGKMHRNKESFSNEGKVFLTEGARIGRGEDACITFVDQNLSIEAVVTVKPRVKVGKGFRVECGNVDIHRMTVEGPRVSISDMFGSSRHEEAKKMDLYIDEECRFVVEQELRIKIPLIFSAQALAQATHVNCSLPQNGSCLDDESEE